MLTTITTAKMYCVHPYNDLACDEDEYLEIMRNARKKLKGLRDAVANDGYGTKKVMWETRRSDMLRLSREVPSITFRVEVRDGNRLELVEYYRGGRSQRCHNVRGLIPLPDMAEMA